MRTKPKEKSIAILAVPAGICVIALSAFVFFLVQITGRMNLSTNQNPLTPSKAISEELNNKISLDRGLLSTLADMFTSGQESAVGETLPGCIKPTDFFCFIYTAMDGEGVDSNGDLARVSDPLSDNLALPSGKDGMSAPYYGVSGRLQITYQSPVRKDEERIGTIYADRAINDYNLPTLSTFNNREGYVYMVDKDGNYIIEPRGTAEQPDIYNYSATQGNSRAVQNILHEAMQGGIGDTSVVINKNQKSFLGLPLLDVPEGSYLITMIPRAAPRRKSTPIIIMLYTMLTSPLIGAVMIANLVTGKQSTRKEARQREYREKPFRNLPTNIDFVSLLYTPPIQKMELMSNNLPVFLGIAAKQVQERSKLVSSTSGMMSDDPAGSSLLNGISNKQVTRKVMVGGGPDEVKCWSVARMTLADYGQYSAVFQETTKEHGMHEHLADAFKQAQNSNQARTAFFSSISHDIRIPVDGIIRMINVALNSLDSMEKAESCLNKITAAPGHLLQLINGVFGTFRIESGEISLKGENAHLPSTMASLISLTKPDMDKKRRPSELKSQILEYDVVVSGGLHLQKTLLNPLSNAMKHIQMGGMIGMQITGTNVNADTTWLCFVVRDNGIGMTPEFLERVLALSERAEDSRMSQAVDTGLGLVITKSIVDTMEGDTYVGNEEDMGSRFTMELPLKLPELQMQELLDLADYFVPTADDNQDACESISLILQETGTHTGWVMNGMEVVERAWQTHVMEDDHCITIVDWKVPEMDGVEAVRRVKVWSGNGAPILLLSTYD